MPPVTGSPSAARGRRHQRLAQDLAGHRVGGTRRDTEQRHVAEEVAPVALAFGQLPPGQIDERMDPPLLPILLAHASVPSPSVALVPTRTGELRASSVGASPIAACLHATFVPGFATSSARAGDPPGLLSRNDRRPMAGCQNRIGAPPTATPCRSGAGPVCAALSDLASGPPERRRRAAALPKRCAASAAMRPAVMHTSSEVRSHHGHARRPEPSHHLPLRPAGRPRTPDRAAAPGAALPHADPELLAQGRAGRALPQLAAGSVRQLPGPARLPEQTRELRVEVDLVAEMAAINPFDFFVEPDAEQFPFSYEPALAKGSRPLSRMRAAPAPLAAAVARAGRRASTPHRRLPGRPEPAPAAATSATSSAWSRASRRREETLEPRSRLVPRFGLAARPDPAPPRARRPLRLRLPDPAQARREVARRPVRRRAGLHRPARLDRGLPARAPAGSASTRPPACSPARATSRSPAPPDPQTAAPDHRRPSTPARSSSASR